MAKQSTRILELAKRGAEARFQDLIHEAKMLMELFPHLRDSFDPDELPLSFIVAKGSGRLKKTTAARRSTPAATRKAVRQRMKKDGR